MEISKYLFPRKGHERFSSFSVADFFPAEKNRSDSEACGGPTPMKQRAYGAKFLGNCSRFMGGYAQKNSGPGT
jgi:hypothetical protein